MLQIRAYNIFLSDGSNTNHCNLCFQFPNIRVRGVDLSIHVEPWSSAAIRHMQISSFPLALRLLFQSVTANTSCLLNLRRAILKYEIPTGNNRSQEHLTIFGLVREFSELIAFGCFGPLVSHALLSCPNVNQDGIFTIENTHIMSQDSAHINELHVCNQSIVCSHNSPPLTAHMTSISNI